MQEAPMTAVARSQHLARTRTLTSSLGRLPWLPIVILLVLLIAAIFAPLIAPHSPTLGDISASMIKPAWLEGGDWTHPLGTDRFGRDILSRVIFGSQIALLVSLTATAVAGTIGTLVGLAAGYKGGFVDSLLMRITDIALSFPLILIAILLAVLTEPSLRNVILVIGFLLWPRYARLVRAETLAIKELDYVALAKVAGKSDLYIVFSHVLPNLVPSLLVVTSLQVGVVIILEGSLSFLGVGVPPPNPDWGLMITEGRGNIATGWWISLFPGIAMTVTVLAANLLGDWLRDHLDPKLRQI